VDFVTANRRDGSLSTLLANRNASQKVRLGDDPSGSPVDFGNRSLFEGEISGAVWLDGNGDQQRQRDNGSLEPAVLGATVFLDLDIDGQLDFFEEPSTPTNNLGEYAFRNLPPDVYHVRYTAPPGFALTVPSSGFWEVSLQRDQIQTGIDFAQQPPAEIRGVAWEDVDGDFTLDVNEPRLSGWTIFADVNNNGALDFATPGTIGEPFSVTNAVGEYSLAVRGGTYVVREVLQSGWLPSFPSAGGHSPITITQGQVLSNVNFGNQFSPGEIRGVVWHDENGNGIRDDVGNDGFFDEPGQFGVTVYLDLNENGALEDDEPSFVTGPGGNYTFASLSADRTYVVAEQIPQGFAQTSPSYASMQRHRIVLGSGQSVVANFGNSAPATISGTKFIDHSNDGRPDLFEPRLAGMFFVDLNRNSRLDAGEPFDATDGQGNFAIQGLPPGTYTIVDQSDFFTLRDPHFELGRDFGFSLAVGDGSIVVGDPRALQREPTFGQFVERGRAYLFDRGNGHQLIRELLHPFPTGSPSFPIANRVLTDGFGWSVAVVDNRAFVGVPFRPFGGLRDEPASEGLVLRYDIQNSDPGLVAIADRDHGYFGSALTFFQSPSRGVQLIVGNPDRFFDPGPSPGSVTVLSSELIGVPDINSDYGASVAVVSNRLLLVGDPGVDPNGLDSGAAYLHDLGDGIFTLLRTFLHPAGLAGSKFGASVAALGNNAIIGAPGESFESGAVYYFDSLTGVSLPTFLNPTPAGGDRFGFSISIVGDKVLIGAPGDDTLGTDAGAAYLFDAATGELLQTFFSPSPLAGAQFGFSLAAVDENRFAVGAPSPNVALDPGAVYVLSIPPRVTITAPGQAATLHFPKVEDDDADGVPDEVEDAHPNKVPLTNLGDGDGDGIPDSRQANVASLTAADNSYVSLVAPAGTTFVDVSVFSMLPAGAPPEADFPLGLFDFTLEGVPAGGSVVVEFIIDGGATFNSYFKYGPTPGNPSPHWYNFASDPSQSLGAHFPMSGNSLFVTFIDGERGDEDPMPGRIRDPGGPAKINTNPNPLPGDYNSNGSVDAADYIIWRKMQGQNVTPYQGADGNGNGIVDDEDHGVWRANFARQLPPAGSAASVSMIDPREQPVLATATVNAGYKNLNSQTSTKETAAARRRADAFGARIQTSSAGALYRPIPRPLDAGPPFTRFERDEALMSLIASQPTDRTQVSHQYVDSGRSWSSEVGSSASDSHIMPFDDAISLLYGSFRICEKFAVQHDTDRWSLGYGWFPQRNSDSARIFTTRTAFLLD
jgi:hypothetical protein